MRNQLLFGNIIRSFAIHAFVCFAAIVLMIFGGLPFGFLFAATGALAGYIFLSKRFLEPIPGASLLSVAPLAAVLFILFGLHELLIFSEGGLFYILNYPSIAVLQLPIFAYSFISGSYVDDHHLLVIMGATLVPSVLMYTGLRLRVRKDIKQSTSIND